MVLQVAVQDIGQVTDIQQGSPLRWGAKWGAIVSRHSATQSLLKRSITGIYQASSYSGRRQPTRQDLVRIEGVAAYLSQTLHEHKRGRVGTDRSV